MSRISLCYGEHTSIDIGQADKLNIFYLFSCFNLSTTLQWKRAIKVKDVLLKPDGWLSIWTHPPTLSVMIAPFEGRQKEEE